MKCSDIDPVPVLEFLKRQGTKWSTHGNGYGMPTVQDAMPPGTPVKIQIAKMAKLIKKGFVSGCSCGCRGDYTITDKGKARLMEAHLSRGASVAAWPRARDH